jgi:hypothetical protein
MDDDRPTAASAPGTTPPQRATVEAPGLFAVLETLALSALGLDATKQSNPNVDERPRSGDTR